MVDLTLDFSPDLPAMWCAIGISIAFLAGSIIITARRRTRGRRPGVVPYVLLAFAALAVYVAYRAYFPSCPRNMWC